MTDQIQTHKFPNGLVLVAEPMPWLESAAFALLVPSGSVYDPEPLDGLASFTCEMALRGAGPYDSRSLVTRLDNLGAERSESVGKSHTFFGAATVTDNLIPALAVYADIVLRPRFPEDELESARQVLLHEIRAIEDDPSQKVMVELRRRHYPHAWGRPGCGRLESVRQIGLDDIRRFHRGVYAPRGTILGVAGRFDWNALVDQVGGLFGDWPEIAPPAICAGDRGPRNAHLESDTAQTHIGVAYDAVPYRDEDYFLAWSGMGILSGGTSSRLFTEVREKRGLCYAIYATYHTLLDYAGIFCYAGTSADRAHETLATTLQEIRRLEQGIDDGELDRLKARIKSALIMQQESSSARAGSIARDWYHLGRVRALAEIDQIVSDLSRSRIDAYLSAHPPQNFTVVTLGPEPLETPHGIS